MLSPELELRMSKIIEKLDKLEKNPVIEDFPSECEKYEYLVQKMPKKGYPRI